MVMLAKGLTYYIQGMTEDMLSIYEFFMRATFLCYHWYLGKGRQLGGEDLDSSLAVEPEQVIKFLRTYSCNLKDNIYPTFFMHAVKLAEVMDVKVP